VMHPLRQAVECAALDTVPTLLAENVIFMSPVMFTPLAGREMVSEILLGVSAVFEDFHYVNELSAPGSRDHALIFKARIGDREIHGCDFVHHDEDGLIDHFTVMVRPLSAAKALARAMEPTFAGIQGRANAV
jgi:hypothetical protein